MNSGTSIPSTKQPVEHRVDLARCVCVAIVLFLSATIGCQSQIADNSINNSREASPPSTVIATSQAISVNASPETNTTPKTVAVKKMDPESADQEPSKFKQESKSSLATPKSSPKLADAEKSPALETTTNKAKTKPTPENLEPVKPKQKPVQQKKQKPSQPVVVKKEPALTLNGITYRVEQLNKNQTLLFLVMEPDIRASVVASIYRAHMTEEQIDTAKKLATTYSQQYDQLLRDRSTVLENAVTGDNVESELLVIKLKTVELTTKIRTRIHREILTREQKKLVYLENKKRSEENSKKAEAKKQKSYEK